MPWPRTSKGSAPEISSCSTAAATTPVAPTSIPGSGERSSSWPSNAVSCPSSISPTRASGDGIDEDAFGIRLLAAELPELILATSCSKNFGLYRERTGAIVLLSGDARAASTARSQLLNVIRGIYSMPPSHGGAIVEEILGDEALRRDWCQELDAMRDRINGLRSLLVERFAARGDAGRFGFIERQRGMFSFLGIDPAQVKALREEHAIYMVDSSRINVAGASRENVDRLCDAVMAVL